jgi:TPR repeat protein
MIRAGCNLLTGCLLLLSPLLLNAGDNSLLIPAQSRCLLEQLPQPDAQTLQYCQSLATGGDSAAQYELGDYYYRHSDGSDYSQAMHWLEMASLQGHAGAQLQLGNMLWRGEGIAVNRIQAWIVFKVAEVNGSDAAIDQADRLALEMNREELERASRVLGEIFREYLQNLDRYAPPSPASAG